MQSLREGKMTGDTVDVDREIDKKKKIMVKKAKRIMENYGKLW